MINVCALSTGEPKPTASKCGAKVLLFFLTDKHFEDYFIIFFNQTSPPGNHRWQLPEDFQS